jgi:hypothetical protein
MDKRELTFTDEGTNAYMRMVEEIVRENFTALDTAGSYEEGGVGSRRDMAEDDLKSVDLDELEGSFEQIDKVLEGVWYIAESMGNHVLMMVVNDSRERSRIALERVQEFRATWG